MTNFVTKHPVIYSIGLILICFPCIIVLFILSPMNFIKDIQEGLKMQTDNWKTIQHEWKSLLS